MVFLSLEPQVSAVYRPWVWSPEGLTPRWKLDHCMSSVPDMGTLRCWCLTPNPKQNKPKLADYQLGWHRALLNQEVAMMLRLYAARHLCVLACETVRADQGHQCPCYRLQSRDGAAQG